MTRRRQVLRALVRRMVKREVLVLVACVLFLSGVMSILNRQGERLPCCGTLFPLPPNCRRCPPRFEAPCTNCSKPGSMPYYSSEGNVSSIDYAVNAPRACKVDDLHYLIAVHSEPHNLVDRQILRMAIGGPRWRNVTIRRIFFMGVPANNEPLLGQILDESKRGDVVIGNFTATPANATLVSVMILKWTVEFCPNAQFIVRLSDSGRTDAKALRSTYRLLKKYSSEFDFFGSLVTLDGQACDVLSGGELKYCAGPGYLTGCVYVMTGHIVRSLYSAAVHHPVFPVAHELYVTYLLADSVGARRVDFVHVHGCYLKRRISTRGIANWLRMRIGLPCSSVPSLLGRVDDYC
ncbi:UDP-GalNAc:beta-1,3-N-acetylgalactosaminyltransferase 1-like [Ornithodoros turicata]|uniref:UDP-GalNAc:beta-1, 3-N-acetylgalactosaminyltransferase 1-like n=1 Tax=Ornithodoros turicata TaxID=34597 RepID=UPI00313A0E06